MRRTIHAIAIGVAMMCCSLLSWSRVRASTVEIGDGLDDEPPAPLIDQQAGSEFAPPTGQTPAFTWSADSSLIPPPYVAAATVEGGKIRQINLNLDPGLLKARGLSILDVVKAVKASTGEGMGFVGRVEGVAALAVATLQAA